MLTEDRVADLIGGGRIELSYRWDPRQRPPTDIPDPRVNPSSVGATATQVFRDAFFGDRLRLTLGPLVLSHRYARLRGRTNFRDLPRVFDLRETENRLELRPGESITINTIESVALDGSIGALTLPRLTHATAGLVLSPSYIDPFWRGVLVLQLSNQTHKRIEIRFGERIAQTFFYMVDGDPLPSTFQSEFAQKSHHYGMDWRRIEEGADPFPLRKGAIPGRLKAEVERLVPLLFNRLTGAGVTVAAIAALIFAGGQAWEKIGEIDDLETRISALEEDQAMLRDTDQSMGEAIESIRRRR